MASQLSSAKLLIFALLTFVIADFGIKVGPSNSGAVGWQGGILRGPGRRGLGPSWVLSLFRREQVRVSVSAMCCEPPPSCPLNLYLQFKLIQHLVTDPAGQYLIGSYKKRFFPEETAEGADAAASPSSSTPSSQ